jgi:hypothetical protein
MLSGLFRLAATSWKTIPGVPSKGSRVAVSGRVMEGITVMGKTFGTAIQEHDHHLR